MIKKSKRIQRRDENIDFSKIYDIREGLDLVKNGATAKFDETVEIVFSCNLDPRKGDQNLRGMVSLPCGTGKSVRIAVFAQGEQAHQAREAGADLVGDMDLIEAVQRGNMDFDLCIATPPMMAHLSKLGKILGPKGLMPNPKLGTVTMDVAAAIDSAKKGQVSLRADKQGIVHGIIGRASFAIDQLEQNFQALYEGLLELKPAGLKGGLVKKIYLSSTMGFSLAIDPAKVLS